MPPNLVAKCWQDFVYSYARYTTVLKPTKDGNWKETKELINDFDYINERDLEGETPLHKLLSRSVDKDVLAIFLNYRWC